MYVFKNLVDLFAMPLSMTFLIALFAVYCRLRGWKSIAVGLIVAAGLIGYLGSMNLVGDALLAPLEGQYPPLPETSSPTGVEFVLVLGSGYVPRDGLPVTAALDEDGLARIVEGVAIVRRLGSVQLVASGGAPPEHATSALGYAKLALELGVESKSLIVVDTPRDTAEEADAAVRVVGDRRFILVTSAYHMPRAMQLMERAGLHPIPAPTGNRGGAPLPIRWRQMIPSGSGLRKTERALHEYLGLVAIRMGSH